MDQKIIINHLDEIHNFKILNHFFLDHGYIKKITYNKAMIILKQCEKKYMDMIKEG